MHFPTNLVRSVAAAALLILAPAVHSAPTTGAGAYSPVTGNDNSNNNNNTNLTVTYSDIGPRRMPNAKELLRCLEVYRRSDNWDGQVCGGKNWFRGGWAWENPMDCYDNCYARLYQGASMAWGSVGCVHFYYFARCWMGYE